MTGYCTCVWWSRADQPRQDRSHNGAKFQRRRRINLDRRPRRPQPLHLAIQLRKAEFLVVVGLALRAVEDAVAALNVAEADEAVERRQQHIPTARARRLSNLLCLPLNQTHGVQPLLRKSSPLLMVGALLPPKHLPPRSHRASFQTARRRAGLVYSLRLRQHQRRLRHQQRSK